MIKRIVLLFAIAAATVGTVWAQSPGNTVPPGVDPPPGVRPAPPAGSGLSGISGLDVVPGLSIDSRHSSGLFSADGDTFINVRFHNPDLDSLVFASTTGARGINLGLARNFGPLYLAFYYGGRLVDMRGGSTSENAAGQSPSLSYWSGDWQSNLALLFGIAGMGFRIDAAMNGDTARSEIDHSNAGGHEDWSLTERRMHGGPSIALTWGMELDALAPWVRVGYRFADSFTRDHEASDFAYTEQLTANAFLEASAGARIGLGDNSLMGFALRFGSTFPDWESYSGTWPAPQPGDTSVDNEFTNRRHGMMAFGLNTYFRRDMEFGMLSLRLRPTLDAGMTLRSNEWYGGTVSWVAPWDRWITVRGGVDMGARLRLNDVFVFFAGAGLRVLDWTYWAEIGGDDMYPALRSSWGITGVNRVSSGIGMTVTPTEAITVGLGLRGMVFGGDAPDVDITLTFRPGSRAANGTVAPAPAPTAVAPAPAPTPEPEAPVAEEEGGAE